MDLIKTIENFLGFGDEPNEETTVAKQSTKSPAKAPKKSKTATTSKTSSAKTKATTANTAKTTTFKKGVKAEDASAKKASQPTIAKTINGAM